MRKRNLILLGIIQASLLLFVATFHYPGGSQIDAQSIGFDWINKYLSNLFSPVAVYSVDNAATLLLSLIWVLGLVYFTTKEDFQHIK